MRIIDFGTARVVNPDLLAPKQNQQIKDIREAEGVNDETLVGSLNYLSPEVLKLQYSEKCDIWAFGVLAYKFIYNHLPFEGRDKIEIFRRIVEEEIEFAGKPDKEFQGMLELCFKKDPAERATAKELKKCALFKDIDFKEVFDLPPPIPVLLKTRSSELSESSSDNFMYEVEVEKKMFFGNFKPRLVTIESLGGRLTMAYRYLPTRKVRNEFELNLNDYAQVTKNG